MKVIIPILLALSFAAHSETKIEATLLVTCTVVAPTPEVLGFTDDGKPIIKNPEYFTGTITEKTVGNVKTVTINY
jgi:hypothetical protein